MIKGNFKINNIPAVLYGKKSDKLILCVHGKMSKKDDVPIEILAKVAVERGYQVLGFDLPKHGDRKNEEEKCDVFNCIKDIKTVFNFAKSNFKDISLFANSMGAFFSLEALKDETINKALFLSPLGDMRAMIEGMMIVENVSEERLEKERIIPTRFGDDLDVDYYKFVKANPIEKWTPKTFILRGECDEICPFETVKAFAEKFDAQLEIVNNSKHYFFTPHDLASLEAWYKRII